MKVWYRNQIGDARECRVSILDHGLLYGDGVFEGIRITGGRVFRLHDHLARLERSARAIGLALPVQGAALAAAVLATARANGESEAYVRLVATRGVGELGVDPASCREPELFCIVASLRMFPEDVRKAGLRLLTCTLCAMRTPLSRHLSRKSMLLRQGHPPRHRQKPLPQSQ